MVPHTPRNVILFAPTSVATDATAGGTATAQLVDTKGYKFVRFRMTMTSGSTSQAPTVHKVQEADVTNTSSLANVSGYVGGTDFTIPAPYTNSATATAAEYANICVPLQGRKRYLSLVATPGTAATIRISADLLRANEVPDTASEANVALLVG